MKTYKTSTGTYKEEELAVVIWINPRRLKRSDSNARFLETMTSEDSPYPMAFPVSSLTTHKMWRNARIARTKEDVYALIGSTERTRPLLVPLPVAKEALDWTKFYVPTEYVS
jgi:hypothetical protein